MIKNLDHADSVVKLTLALSVLLCYGFGIIAGPFAHALGFLSGVVIIIFVVKTLRANAGKNHQKPS
ncbi:MAG TPA: hypothetical protein PK325_14530 [Cyclobacteriaceae bacterium]|nr:hypothetical protein [Cyclobacteriaceae bacterium]HMV08443.1 hypothetical protein [Cyclobacteriaceae bacterium]HMV91178.1 hypothetical protein [Cyclobacteriaceae bacterium]HMX01216.1 hypothetical protein [Cyclobacteriaceae bacterium]HMX50619.1 hypothetical protein [Cyclobacteriaceae bacterium]